MAKIIKKIRISEYDALKNEFNISFQLAGNDELKFEAVFSADLILDLKDSTAANLNLLGLTDFFIRSIVDEVFNWLSKPRKSLGGLSHIYTMRSRFEATERLEAERRTKAEAERIDAEAPCLDWAMSVMAEMEDAGLGEENTQPIDLEDLLYNFEDLAAERQKLSTWHERETHPEYYDICDKVDDARQAILDHVASVKQAATPVVAPASLPTEAKAEADRANDDEARYQYRRKIADDRTELAINAIHTQARRFTKPMTLREHDFLRDVIREEIERVLGGVL